MCNGNDPLIAQGKTDHPDFVGAVRDLPLGHIIATANLVDCVPMIEADSNLAAPYAPHLSAVSNKHPDEWWYWKGQRTDPGCARWDVDNITEQLPYGHFEPGRWGWILKDIDPIGPVHVTGSQGIWEWTPPQGTNS